MNYIKCILLRHGKTPGNMEKRYIGKRTDEALSEEGKSELSGLISRYNSYIFSGTKDEAGDKTTVTPSVRFYSGAMRRCKETMELLFPAKPYEVLENLTEIDFGDFEGHNYSELSGNADYQKWIDSNGTIAFPNGESREAFIVRTVNALESCIRNAANSEVIQNSKNIDMLVFVCHGGNIMSFLSDMTGRDYFDFMCDPGDGYEVVINVTEDKIDVISYHRIFDGLDT